MAPTEKTHDFFGGHYIVVSAISGMTIVSDMTTISGISAATENATENFKLDLPTKTN